MTGPAPSRSGRGQGGTPRSSPMTEASQRDDRFIALADQWAPRVFVMPAVLIVLALSIFPLIISLYLSLARFKFEKGGFSLQFIGLINYKKLLLGSQQFHFLGTLPAIAPLGWAFVAVVAATLILWLVLAARRGASLLG